MPDEKITLWQMVLACEDEITRLEIWATVLGRENKKLAPAQAMALDVWRQTSKTLQLLIEFEQPFVNLVHQTRQARRLQLEQAAALAPKKSPTASKSPVNSVSVSQVSQPELEQADPD